MTEHNATTTLATTATTSTLFHSQEKSGKDSKKLTANTAAGWTEYSKFHDSFTELLYYENKRGFHSDIWQLNYI